MLTDPIQLGDPVEYRGVVVAPLFPHHTPTARYLTLDEAASRGFRVTEVDAAGSVPELAVVNPLGEHVLLYDGEELAGAMQNRILNVTVLVAASSKLRIPVSCVEQGRWASRSAAFRPAGHVTDPELRRRKNVRLAEEPLARGDAQYEVWNAVSEKAMRLGAYSPTSAHADTYKRHERSLEEVVAAFPLQPGQTGALLALGEDTLCLDYVSRPDAFARLYPKLLTGYALDALEHIDRPAAPAAALGGLLETAAALTPRRQPSEGLGEDVRLDGRGVLGSGLQLEGELIQLSLFTHGSRLDRPGRIARPSRRR